MEAHPHDVLASWIEDEQKLTKLCQLIRHTNDLFYIYLMIKMLTIF